MLSIMPTERRTSPRICAAVQGQARGIGGAEGIERRRHRRIICSLR
jgi:hypothetical protein